MNHFNNILTVFLLVVTFSCLIFGCRRVRYEGLENFTQNLCVNYNKEDECGKQDNCGWVQDKAYPGGRCAYDSLKNNCVNYNEADECTKQDNCGWLTNEAYSKGICAYSPKE